MKKKYIAFVLGLGLLSSACNLDLEPEGQLSSAKPFQSIGEMSSYIDQFYENGLRKQDFFVGGGGAIAGGDSQSDNMSGVSANDRLNGSLTLSGAANLGTYKQIRNINFLLNNLGNVTSGLGSAEYNQLVGEAYYFRAWYHYRLFVDYGPITYLEEPLPATQEAMLRKRNSRIEVADKILADLDKAIELLKEEKNASTMRIHRDVARAFKSEVALFEATWEKYHKAKQTPFYDQAITEEKIRNYLQQASDAAKAVIDRSVWQIYSSGKPNEDYRRLFMTSNLKDNTEVLWFKMYDGDQVGNNVNRYLNKGGGVVGITASLVDDYLTKDGRPFVGEAKLQAKRVWGDELKPELRDPRLSQTVVPLGTQLREAEIVAGKEEDTAYKFPPLNGSSHHQNVTGYSLLKHVQTDAPQANLDPEFKGATPAIQFRYADVLLNYAEALAELDGAGNAEAIKEALRPLRERVAMPGVDFDREHNTEADYPFRSLDKYIQAVRRERRVEQACEGKRRTDIFRWAAAEELIIGKHPQGALFTGSDLPAKFQDLRYDQAKDNNLFLTGAPGDTERYILPINPKVFSGWGFNPARDYLLPIRQNMLTRTGNLWTQNPGW